jgi:hypothetical protein
MRRGARVGIGRVCPNITRLYSLREETWVGSRRSSIYCCAYVRRRAVTGLPHGVMDDAVDVGTKSALPKYV